MVSPRSTVETVRGPVALDALGRTLMHEHVVLLSPEALANFGHVWGARYWDEEAGVADVIAKLRRLREAGYETLVDPPRSAGAAMCAGSPGSTRRWT